MHQIANFIGELGGEAWTTQSVAVLVASILAPSAAIITAVVTASQGRLNRTQGIRLAVVGRLDEQKLKGRQDWWVQFAWAAERLYGTDAESVAVAAVVLDNLEQAPWASDEQRALVTEVLDGINSNIADDDIQEARHEQNNQG